MRMASTHRPAKQIWTKHVDEHPGARATGSPTYYNGRVYVPLAGAERRGAGAERATYECCTFRGQRGRRSTPAPGAQIWKTYTIAEEPKKENAASRRKACRRGDLQAAAIWSAPTIDARRRVLYVSTGNGFADPPQPTTDAVIANGPRQGHDIKWVNQPGVREVWMMGCQAKNPDNPPLPGRAGAPTTTSRRRRCSRRKSKRPGHPHHPEQSRAMVVRVSIPTRGGAKVWEYKSSAGSGPRADSGAAPSTASSRTSASTARSCRHPAACAP